MSWPVEVTDEFIAWYDTLDAHDEDKVVAAIDRLEELGPALGRPTVDTIQGSHLPNLKELRPAASAIRILFAFDPRRVAILLLGGDKRGEWGAWYARMIPRAEQLYADHLAELRREGFLGDEQ